MFLGQVKCILDRNMSKIYWLELQTWNRSQMIFSCIQKAYPSEGEVGHDHGNLYQGK